MSDSQTVLVVDDDHDLLNLVRLVVQGDGYLVETASDGREALAAVARHMPNLILLDMKMPVMNGWEFAAEFAAAYGSSTPIVVITAAADARKAAEDVGAVSWLGKPFDIDTLIRAVRRYIR